MPIVTPTAVAVDDSPAQLLASCVGGLTPVTIYNAGTDEVYLGGSDVTSATGLPVVAGQSFSYDLGARDELYAICASGETATVRVLKGLS